MSGLQKVNTDQRLYVLRSGSGFTCLGFDVAYNRAKGYAKWCGCTPPDPTLIGTVKGYEDYERCLKHAHNYHLKTGERCPTHLEPQLIGLEGRRVEVVYPWGEKKRFWVGRSTGWCPIHLEIARRNCHGGSRTVGPYESVTVVR